MTEIPAAGFEARLRYFMTERKRNIPSGYCACKARIPAAGESNIKLLSSGFELLSVFKVLNLP